MPNLDYNVQFWWPYQQENECASVHPAEHRSDLILFSRHIEKPCTAAAASETLIT
jgi:hypothetical protein